MVKIKTEMKASIVDNKRKSADVKLKKIGISKDKSRTNAKKVKVATGTDSRDKKRKLSALAEEADFVRGKQNKSAAPTLSLTDDDLFKEAKPERKVRKVKDEHELGKPLEELTYKKLAPGMLVLGVVSQVGELDVVVNLPNGLTGFINGTAISEEFNKVLGEDTEEDGDQQEVVDICDLVCVGQYLVCSVVEIEVVNKIKKVKLTTKPEMVNKHIAGHNIAKNLVLQGVVQSVEDHGYLINIGIPNTTAFLNKADTKQLKTCDIVTVAVKSVTNNSVIVGLYNVSKLKTLSDKVVTTFSTLLPGHLVNVNVKKQAVNGVRCSFLGGIQGVIHLIHLTDLFNSKSVPDVYPVKRKLIARVLLVNPATKTVLLSMLPCHVAMETPSYTLTKGAILEDIEVIKVSRKGVFVDLGEGVTGFVHVSKLQDEQTVKINANYKTGTQHKCRVMGFRLLDDLVQVSLKPSDIAKPFLSYHDITPCSIVIATIVNIEEFGLVVKLADNIRGIVPKLHLADVRIKNIHIKFKPNQKVKAKVLTVDPVKRRLSLTLKRSIVKNSTSDVPSYECLEAGQHVTGWVAAIKQFGMIMNFTNSIRGLVHVNDISNTPLTVDEISRLYKVGQVLTCRVVRANSEDKKLSLSLNLLGELENKENKNMSTWARRGQIVSCTVISNTPEGLATTLDTSKESAFLPANHLSDHASLVQPLLLYYKPGTKLRKVIVLNKKAKKVTISAKPSFISWMEQRPVTPKITDFSVGDFVPGYIRDFQEYGCFVEIPNGLVGLCPKACLTDEFTNCPRDVYSANETVMCKITNIDTEKERFLVSLKYSEAALEETMSGARLMTNYFSELAVFQNSVTSFHTVGSVCGATVQRVTEQGYHLKLETGTGFTPTEYADATLVAGDCTKGVVLDCDPSSQFYILHLKSEFVQSIESSKRVKLVEGSEHDARVVLIKPDYFVVVLPDAGNRFGYIHKRAHINDHKKVYKHIALGDSRRVTVVRAKKGKPVILGIVKSAEETKPRPRKRQQSENGDVKFADIEIGKSYSVSVKSVKQLQLNVQLGKKVRGRVHITEVTDTPEENSNPLTQYKHGDTLDVKLIGFRHSKTHRYLPITRTDFIQSVGEFSLRKSILECENVKIYKENEKVDELKDYIAKLTVGEEVTGFVRSVDVNGFIWICLTPGVEARLWYMLTSRERSELDAWQTRFTIGQCITCTVFNIQDNRVDLSLVGHLVVGTKLWGLVKSTLPGIGVKLKLSARDYGIVPLTEISDRYTKEPLSKFTEDNLVQCAVLETPDMNKKLLLSLRKSRTSQRWKKAGSHKVVHQVVTSPSNLIVDNEYAGYIKSVSEQSGLYVALGYNVTGRVLFKNMSDNFLKNWKPMFPLNKLVKVVVMETEPKVELSMKRTDLEKARKMKKGEEKEEEEGSADEQDVRRCLDEMLLAKYQGSSDEDEKSDEDEEADAPNITFSNKGNATEATPGAVSLTAALADVEEAEEEEVVEEEEENKENTEKGKSFVKREKKRKREAAEEETRKIEIRDKTTSQPQTEDDYERLAASSPDSSSTWVSYMAYWLEEGRADRARQTAKRALTTINYRLEEEKLNVWSAMFNLENTFGTHESLMAVCKEAAAVNDTKAVFTRLVAVLDKSGKYQEMEEIYQAVLLKKHKHSRKVWCSLGTSLAGQGKLSEVRELLPRALKSLSKHKHIRTISHFALLEYKQGDPNRGSTMFESVLNTYPQRLDLWAVYFDKTIAQNDQEQTRLLFERTIGLKLPHNKMRFFFKRYLNYEISQDDQARIKIVRNKAKLFVEQSVGE